MWCKAMPGDMFYCTNMLWLYVFFTNCWKMTAKFYLLASRKSWHRYAGEPSSLQCIWLSMLGSLLFTQWILTQHFEKLCRMFWWQNVTNQPSPVHPVCFRCSGGTKCDKPAQSSPVHPVYFRCSGGTKCDKPAQSSPVQLTLYASDVLEAQKKPVTFRVFTLTFYTNLICVSTEHGHLSNKLHSIIPLVKANSNIWIISYKSCCEF